MSDDDAAHGSGKTDRNPDVGQIDYVQLRGIPDVHFMRVTRNRQYWNVFHEDYVLCPCRDAAAEWRYRGRDHRLDPGVTMLLEPGETHVNVRVLKRADFVVVWLPPAVMQDAAHELGRSDRLHFGAPQTVDPALFAAIYALSQCDPHQALEQQSRLVQIQRALFERHAERPVLAWPARRERAATERAARYLRERWSDPVTLMELAAVVGLSRFHLVHCFVRHFGIPPHRYQLRVRIERARLLLKRGVSVADVALSTGFADQSHLTRHFRATFGITPSRMRCLTS